EAPPISQNPSASSHETALNVNPSYSSATSTSAGRSDVRVQRCAAWPSTCGSWVSVSWSHEMRSVICVPTASTGMAGLGRSPATDASDTMTATDASHGTSQSYKPN